MSGSISTILRTYRTRLERLLVEVGSKDFQGHLLHTLRICSAHQCHRCKSLCESGSLSGVIVHGIFAYCLHQGDRLHWWYRLEENDCISSANKTSLQIRMTQTVPIRLTRESTSASPANARCCISESCEELALLFCTSRGRKHLPH